MVAVDALSDCGLQPYEACDADEALAMLEEHPDISLVFTDIHMPGHLNGLDLVRKVHDDHPEIELIVTSGRERLLDCDLPDSGSFLAKPYRPSELIDLIRRKMRLVPRLA
jgi:CheY-like chemotaxis protein